MTGAEAGARGLVSWRIQARCSEWPASSVSFHAPTGAGNAEPIARLFRLPTPAAASLCHAHARTSYPLFPLPTHLAVPVLAFCTFFSCPTVLHSLREPKPSLSLFSCYQRPACPLVPPTHTHFLSRSLARSLSCLPSIALGPIHTLAFATHARY